jgi:hypothetical protein
MIIGIMPQSSALLIFRGALKNLFVAPKCFREFWVNKQNIQALVSLSGAEYQQNRTRCNLSYTKPPRSTPMAEDLLHKVMAYAARLLLCAAVFSSHQRTVTEPADAGGFR